MIDREKLNPTVNDIVGAVRSIFTYDEDHLEYHQNHGRKNGTR